MTGPNEERLSKALSADPDRIALAEASWTDAADGLCDVSAALASARERVAAAWTGAGADSATAAFADLGASVDEHELNMRRVAESLSTAGAALQDAKQAYHDLPEPPPAPTAPEPGAGGEISPEDEVHYLKLQGQRSAVLDARETQAGVAYTELRNQLAVANQSMTAAAPGDVKRWKSDGSGGAGAGDGAGAAGVPSSGGGYTAPGTTRAHVGPYSTADTGTHLGAGGHVAGAVLDGGRGSSHADGVVGGVLGGAVGGHVAAGPVLGGGPGSLAANAVGGTAGVVGVAAGLGALGVAAGLRGAGSLGGTLAGAGALAGEEALAGGVLGARGVPGVTGVTGAALGGVRSLGGVSSVGGTTGTGGSLSGRAGRVLAGTTALSEGEAVPATGTAGARGAVVGAAGSTSPGSGSTSTSRGAAGGNGAGGRGAAGGRNASGGRGQGAVHGATGQRDEERDRRRKHLVFEDDAWLDDETGPGVLQ